MPRAIIQRLDPRFQNCANAGLRCRHHLTFKRQERRPKCAGGRQLGRRVRKLPPNRVAKRAAGFHLLGWLHTPAKLVRNNIGIKIKLDFHRGKGCRGHWSAPDLNIWLLRLLQNGFLSRFYGLFPGGSFGGTGAFSSGIMELSYNMMDRRERADVPEGYSSALLARVSTGTV